MSERDVRFDASAHLHLRDNGLLSLLLADNGIATLPRDIGDGRASSVARGRSGDVSTGARFDSVIAVRKRRMTWDVNRCPFSTRQTEADILGCPLKPNQTRTGLERLACQPSVLRHGRNASWLSGARSTVFITNLERQL